MYKIALRVHWNIYGEINYALFILDAMSDLSIVQLLWYQQIKTINNLIK